MAVVKWRYFLLVSHKTRPLPIICRTISMDNRRINPLSVSENVRKHSALSVVYRYRFRSIGR